MKKDSSIIHHYHFLLQISGGKDDQTEHQTMDIMKVGASVPDVWRPERDGSLSSASRVEQCRWRLERLLGRSAEVARIGNEEDEFTMDSVCTEDFSARFREEMLVLPASGTQTEQEDVNTHNDGNDVNKH